jgi:hypothetical protein
MLTRRLPLPYRVGLVAAGLVLALLPLAPKITLTKELICGAPSAADVRGGVFHVLGDT